jgi:hypothetical protein
VPDFTTVGIGKCVLINKNLFFSQMLVKLQLAGHLVITWI